MEKTMGTKTFTNLDIRRMLTEDIMKARSGKVGSAYLNAISNATGKYLSSVKLELEFCKLLGIKPGTTYLGLPPVKPTKGV
jgi:hypothetical protein